MPFYIECAFLPLSFFPTFNFLFLQLKFYASIFDIIMSLSYKYERKMSLFYKNTWQKWYPAFLFSSCKCWFSFLLLCIFCEIFRIGIACFFGFGGFPPHLWKKLRQKLRGYSNWKYFPTPPPSKQNFGYPLTAYIRWRQMTFYRIFSNFFFKFILVS